MDTECYVNYWSIGFKCVETGERWRYSSYNDSPLDLKGIARTFKHWRVVSFNGINYDMPMVALAMRVGTTNGQLKQASDGIILADIRPWQFMELHNVTLPEWIDHIDLMEVSPGAPQEPSLKQYGGRLHSKRIQDLPIPVDARLTPAQVADLEAYHDNDLDVTHDFYRELKSQIDIRCVISDQYNLDLRSKSDAQIAEAIIISEVEKENRRRVYKPKVVPHTFYYKPPAWVKFNTPAMQEILHKLKTVPFVVNHKGKVEEAAYLREPVRVGRNLYQMGVGGLHSKEKSVFHVSDDKFDLIDQDVTSFYPRNIVSMKLYPEHLGPATLKVFQSILDRRVAAKKRGDKDWAETLKIVVNGFFGKTGQPGSKLYSPSVMIHTTITGQLGILMLIEEVERFGMEVVSANTDGFVTKVPKDRSLFDAIIGDWQWDSDFALEESRYKSLSSRDVNNYIAIYHDGKVKLKGALGKGGPGLPGAAGMKKNVDREICIDAVVAYIKNGTPLRDTIYESDDVRGFVTIRKVNGGALKDGVLIGKTIRIYYSRNTKTAIYYKTNGNLVSKSEGAMPLMELPDDYDCPDDLDREWYVREATALLQDIGYSVIDPKLVGRTGYVLGNMEDQKTFHYVRLPQGVAACGKAPESIRDAWQEVAALPDGHRLCAKCRKAMEL